MGNIIEISDFNAPELDVYARLTEAQLLNRFDPQKAMFIAESPKVICRALDGGCQPVSILVERSRMAGESLEAIERCEGVPVYTADMDVLTQLTGYRLTRGLLCAMKRPPAGCRADPCKYPPDRSAGGDYEPHQYWRDLPLCCGVGNGCCAAYRRLQ